MFNSQAIRGVFLAVAAAAFLTVAGCSNQTPNQATNQAPAPAQKAAAPKPATKPAAAKFSVKKAEPAKAVTAKNQPAKQIAVSSKPVSDKAASATLVTVPQGTILRATVGQALASNKNHSGDTFAAVLSSSIKVDGKTVIPKGAHVTGRVVTAKKKSPELTVALASVDVNGKSYKLVTDPINRGPKTQAKSDASDTDAAEPQKDISLPAQSHLKFKLAKPVKIPVKS